MICTQCSVESVLSDLASNLHPGLVDVLIFNPPYVPTPSEEVCGRGIEAAWAGGRLGREVIDKFLPKIPTLLSPSGVCYLLLVQDNKPTEIQAILRSSYQLQSDVIMRRQAKNEHLLVLRISR